METYRIQFDNDIIRYDNIDNQVCDSFIISITLDHGCLIHGQLKYRDYKYHFSENQISVINNRLKYCYPGNNLQDIFSKYCKDNHYSKPVFNYLCEYCAYLLFFNFAASNCFYKILPISTPLPLENFSALLNRSNMSLINFVCNTFRKISPNESFLTYTTSIVNFISKFDLIFHVGKSLEIYDVSTFCISLMLEINTFLTTKICNLQSRFLSRRLDSKDSQPDCPSSTERSISPISEEEIDDRSFFHHSSYSKEEVGELPSNYGDWLQFAD